VIREFMEGALTHGTPVSEPASRHYCDPGSGSFVSWLPYVRVRIPGIKYGSRSADRFS
jgi:hypothetical protein